MKTKFLLHSNSFSERGDSVTLLAIGGLIKEELGFDCVIAIPANAEHISDERVSEAISRGFDVFRYRDKSDLDNFAKDMEISHSYVFSGGKRADLSYFDKSDPESFRISDTRHITHVVFRNFDPHGEVYAYVSDWLFNWAKPRIFIWKLLHVLGFLGGSSATNVTSFPHFLEAWPKSTAEQALREELGIPEDSHVIGRIGGFREFDDPAARKGVRLILDAWEDSYAVFVNTPRFLDHPRAIFLEKLSRADVRRFYDACDVLLNGRRMGESFGYSIVEPLSLGKPVIAPNWVRNPLMDKNHIRLLRGQRLLYSSARNLLRIYSRCRQQSCLDNSSNITNGFSPQEAAKKLRAILA
jgi:glycosyltransferase involved in cell wall biosynthesis